DHLTICSIYLLNVFTHGPEQSRPWVFCCCLGSHPSEEPCGLRLKTSRIRSQPALRSWARRAMRSVSRLWALPVAEGGEPRSQERRGLDCEPDVRGAGRDPAVALEAGETGKPLSGAFAFGRPLISRGLRIGGCAGSPTSCDLSCSSSRVTASIRSIS